MSVNLGQVVGLFVGTSSPTNTNLIWFDSTVSVKYHKVYNFDLNIWEKLNKSSISNKTYSELVTLATGSGLSLGAQYYITNLDVLAVAITATKVNYFDTNDNLIVDDLSSTKSYIISASNLLIDDIQGVYDENTKKVVFSFQSDTFDGEDYAFAKGTRTSVVKLLKYKWKTIVSSKVNNSIVWDGGIYFNLKAALSYIFDKSGGVVSYETFVTSNTTLSNQLLALSNNYQNFANNANQTIETGLSPTNFYSKQIYNAPDVGAAAADIVISDSLYTIVSKIQRYINRFKRADGMLVTASFVPSTSENLNIINTDTVDNALRKVQTKINSFDTYKTYIDESFGIRILAVDALSGIFNLRMTRKNKDVVRLEGFVKVLSDDLFSNTGASITIPASEEVYFAQEQSNIFYCNAYLYQASGNLTRNFLVQGFADNANVITFKIVPGQTPPMDGPETYFNYILFSADLLLNLVM